MDPLCPCLDWLIYELDPETKQVPGLMQYSSEYARLKPSQQTRNIAIVCSMLVHRLRRWPNIEPTMSMFRVFLGYWINPLSANLRLLQLRSTFLFVCQIIKFD